MSAPTTFQKLLDDEVLDIGDGYRAKNSELTGGGEIFLRAGHVTDTHIDFEGVERFDSSLGKKVESKMSKVGDTIITTKGNSTGRTSFVTPDIPRFVYSPHLCYWRSTNPERIENGFLRYWARGNEFQCQLAALKASTDMAPYLSLKDQKRLKITLPPIEEQRAIASILGALDDKIELNRRMNATLESLARAIFKSWFVDFDPVKINAGQMPASSQALATHDPKVLDLFPSTFQDSPLGLIPEGWRIERWGNIATLEYGKSLKGYRDSDGHIRVWGTNGPIGWHTLPLCDSAGIIIGRKGAYRGVHYSPKPFFAIDTAFYLKPICDFDLMWAYYELLRFDINGMDSGSAIPSTSRDDFYSIPVRVPPPEMLTKFGEVLDAGLARRYANERESEILGRNRDALLPQLLSGDLPVPAALTRAEEALP